MSERLLPQELYDKAKEVIAANRKLGRTVAVAVVGRSVPYR